MQQVGRATWDRQMAATTHVNVRDASSTQPLLGADEYDAYSWVLLEDHPLRSHPTECCPGVLWVLRKCCVAVTKRWSDRALTLICLFLMFLVAIQFLSLLPYGVSYLFLHEQYKAQSGFIHWPAEFEGQPAACISYNPRAHANSIQYSLAAGCTGVKADIWLQDDDILVGSSWSSLRNESTLRKVYLEPLLDHFDAMSLSEAQPAHDSMVATGLFGQDSLQFKLYLEIRSSADSVWPRLLSELALLSERGYLTHRNGTQVVPGPITIVLTGQEQVELDGLSIDHESVGKCIFLDESVVPEVEESAAVQTSTEDEMEFSEQNLPGTFPRSDEDSSLTKALQMYSASINFAETIGSPHRGRFSRQQIERIQSQVQTAHQKGLLARYEGIPCHSEGMRRIIWRILVNEGADLIEVDWTGCASRGWRRFFSIGSRGTVPAASHPLHPPRTWGK
ncbi:altered inheritance of mitochondria protein 6 [Aspergillus tubingensis]|nr:altered inheritance of mitochondria protein 6 [Aspergillus tubingensis]GLB15703.1 altered inheritance of mitochondria protein 6 [Aspergillus tubingensis]